MKKCEDIQYLLTLYALGNLGRVSKDEVEEHLKKCTKCQTKLEEVKQGLNIINDVLEETSDKDSKLSAERHLAILRATKIKKSHWITTHKPLLGIAASTILVFGLSWAIVNSIQPMMNLESQQKDSFKEFADSFVMTEELIVDSFADDKSDGIDAFGLGGEDSGEINGTMSSEGNFAQTKPASQPVLKPVSKTRLSSSLGEPQPKLDMEFESLDMAFDSEVNMSSPQNNPSPSPADVDAIAMVKSPVVLSGIYGSRSPGARGAAMKRYSGNVDLRKEDLYAQQHAISAKEKQIAPQESEYRKKSADRSVEVAKGYTSSQTESLPTSGLVLSGRISQPDTLQVHKKRALKRNIDKSYLAKNELIADAPIQLGATQSSVSVLDAEEKKLQMAQKETDEITEVEELCEEIEVVSECLADYDKDGKEIVARQSMIRATGVNPYVQTVDNAFSTFSIDVDTASYNLCRRYMLAGILPPPEMVRTEEFINSFDYHYVPAANQTFRIYTDIAPSPFAHGQYMLKIGVKGKRLGREEQKQAVLTFLVDTSGSMKRADRIDLIKQSLKFLLEQLGENDKVAIVQYGTKARLVLEHTEVKDFETIMRAIDSLQCGGATDLEDGMLLAYKVAADGYIPNAENKVLLLSDGVANIGEGVAQNILTKINPYIKQGITCSIYGFGIGNYDDVMLETLANKGNGIYAYVGNIRDAKTIFSDESAAILNLIASDVKIQVEFSPSVVKQYRQLGYENRQLTQQDFRNDMVDAGEIGSGQSVTALYELELAENEPMEPWRNSMSGLHSGDVLAIVRVRYRDINSGEIHEIEQKVRERDIKSSFDRMPTEYRLAVSVAEFAEQLRNSPYAQNNFRDVLNIITPVANELPLNTKVQEIKNFIQYAPNWSR